MYLDDDTMTPRDRISDDMLRRILDESTPDLSRRDATQQNPFQNQRPMCQASMEHGNNHHTWGLENHPLASVYAPLQEFRKLYDRQTALDRGTLFTELDLPFMGETVGKGGKCHV